eukprot:s825_g1.t1
MTKVTAAVRMLGAGFFQEVTTGKKVGKLKIYDSSTMLAEGQEPDDSQGTYHAESAEEMNDDELFDVIFQEGDEDAMLIADFETAASDVLQSDEELASAINAYTEARRRLNDKAKSRGFWPPKGKYKGGSKGVKGKVQKGHQSNRKSLQQRILTSACRICGKVGHWKAECPSRNDQAANARPQAQASFVQVQDSQDSLPLEFMNLPTFAGTLDDAQHDQSECFACYPSVSHDDDSKARLRQTIRKWLDQQQEQPMTMHLRSDEGTNDAKSRLRKSLQRAPASETVASDVNTKCEHPVMFATLKQLQVAGEIQKPSFDHLSMQQLEESVIDFGQAHKGRTYLEESHLRFLHFLNLKIERAELTGASITINPGPKMMKGYQPKMKAKAMPRPMSSQGPEEIPILDEDQEDIFEFLPAEMEMPMQATVIHQEQMAHHQEQMAHLESRVLSMEDTLSRILAHLENPSRGNAQ